MNMPKSEYLSKRMIRILKWLNENSLSLKEIIISSEGLKDAEKSLAKNLEEKGHVDTDMAFVKAKCLRVDYGQTMSKLRERGLVKKFRDDKKHVRYHVRFIITNKGKRSLSKS